MKNIYLYHIFKSQYCQITFLIALIISLFIIPKGVFNTSLGAFLGSSFILTFSLAIACFVRNIKERIMITRTYKSSFLGGMGAVLGLAASQVCGVGASVCTASVGVGLSFLLPGFILSYINQYSLIFLAISIMMQLLSLYFMDCFKRIE